MESSWEVEGVICKIHGTWEGWFAKVLLQISPPTSFECPVGSTSCGSDWSFHSLHAEVGFHLICCLFTSQIYLCSTSCVLYDDEMSLWDSGMNWSEYVMNVISWICEVLFLIWARAQGWRRWRRWGMRMEEMNRGSGLFFCFLNLLVPVGTNRD
jgi:hypothetical protein